MTQVADMFVSKLENFDKSNFLSKALEGHLFPDTYFFFTTANENDVLESMTENFNKKNRDSFAGDNKSRKKLQAGPNEILLPWLQL